MRQRNLRGWTVIAAALLFAATAAHADLDTAMNQFKAGKYLEAAAEFQALVDASPNYDFGYSMIGNCFLKMKKPGEAEKNFQKAIELNGEKFAYHYGLATAYFQQRQYGKAIGTLRTAEGLAADNAEKYRLYALRGAGYYADEKWADAIDDLEKANRIQKSGATSKQLGVAYYNMGHYDKALPALDAALAASPKDDATIQRLATVHMNLGAKGESDAAKKRHYDQSLKFAKQYRDMNPTDVEAHNLLGRAALGAQEYAQAEQSFRTVLDKKSDHCYAMANLGKTYIAQEKWTDAESILGRAAKCAPRLGVVYESLGFALQKQKRYDEAIPVYKKALEIEPKSSTREAIDICQKNIEIAEHNEEQERIKAEQEAAARKAEEEYAKELEKRKEYEKKTGDN